VASEANRAGKVYNKGVYYPIEVAGSVVVLLFVVLLLLLLLLFVVLCCVLDGVLSGRGEFAPAVGSNWVIK
jgi:hypothetical protein